MAVKATVFKVELQVNDMDRNYYQAHTLTVAQHPSETEQRLIVRILAFALNASEGLAFGKGISTDDEPDLWQKDLTGQIETWIETGQPDEQRIRKACGRATRVLVYTFSGRSAAIWWEKNSAALARCDNLGVIDISAESVLAITGLARRSMRLQCFVQDGHVQLMDDDASVDIELSVLKVAGVSR